MCVRGARLLSSEARGGAFDGRLMLDSDADGDGDDDAV